MNQTTKSTSPTTPNQAIEVTPFTCGLGAKVTGLDLSTPLNPEQFARVYEAFLDHQLLLFRGQQLDESSQVAFGRWFGELQIHVMNQYHSNQCPELYRLSNLDEDGNPNGKHPDKGTLAWHTDGSWKPVTGQATILYAELVPPPGNGGETHFCDMYRAMASLTQIHGDLTHLKAIHNLDFSRQRRHGEQPLTEAQKKQTPPVSHPVVRVHPETGKHALYLGDHAETIEGLPYDEGRALVETLNAQAIDESRVYEHTWRPGDLMVWDNRCVQHRATAFDTQTQRRVIRRCTVLGERPRGPND